MVFSLLISSPNHPLHQSRSENPGFCKLYALLNKYNNIGKLAPPIPAFEKGRLKNRCCIWSCEMVIEILSLKQEGEIDGKIFACNNQ
jgi:hypothetical protein